MSVALRSMRSRAACHAALRGLLMAFFCLAGPGAAFSQDEAAPKGARYLYPVHFICGDSSEAFQEAVVAGAFKTAINIVNSSAAANRLDFRIARSLPYQASGDGSALPAVSLDPQAAIEIECDQLRGALAAPATAQLRAGYVEIFSTAPLHVTAVYSAGPAAGDQTSVDVVAASGRALCGPGETLENGGCRCPKGLAGRSCEISTAEESGPTFLRLKWVGIDAPGDVARSDDDCFELEVQNVSGLNLRADVEFYGTLNGHPRGMVSPLSSLPLHASETGTINRCLRDFEGEGGASDLLDLAFSAVLNARATVRGGLDGSGGRLDRMFAPTAYFHVDPAPELFVPYRSVLYDDTARRQTFGGGDYAGRFGFALPGGGIFVGDTHPDELYDEGGPAPPAVVPVP